MASIWDKHSAKMDAKIDAVLGDTIQFSDAGGAFAPIQGFVVLNDETLGVEGLDENLGSTYRIKVAKAIIALPTRAMRFQHPMLGAGTFRPGNALPASQGRYWVFDVQKV